ncbi:MAG: reverse transcriptase family protein, partial [Bacteroidota bacterium]
MSGCYQLPIKINTTTLTTQILFVNNLQVDCIIGMDTMSKANVTINTNKKTISVGAISNTANEPPVLTSLKESNVPVNSETLIKFAFSKPFTNGLIESTVFGKNLHVMDGVTESYEEDGKHFCSLVLANFGQVDEILPRKSTLEVFIDPDMIIEDINSVMAVDEQRVITQDNNYDHILKVDLRGVPQHYISRYHSLLRNFSDVFSKDDLDIGHCKDLPHRIRLKDPNRITSINQYRLPHHLKEVAIEKINKLLQSGVIRRSSSIFNSPLMLVKKPRADPTKPLGEQYRLVHNYIDLNRNIAPCSYPLRNLYELLDEVATGKVFSTLDLSQGFWQQHLDDPLESTSFSLPGVGQYTYTRSPQGLNSSPAYFQRLLDYVLQGINRVYVFIDDIVISVNSHDENILKLREVFERFRKYNLKIKPSKCNIGAGTITYLGYEISAKQGISPGKIKTEVIANWPTPKSIKD